MSYSPKTWGTGDTVYASDLNRIENGIANAGGSFAVVALSATGYSSASRTLGYIVYARRVNNTWVVVADDNGDWLGLYAFGNNILCNFIPPQYAMVSSEVCPFLVNVQADEIVTTGDVSDTPENIYYSYGSGIQGGGYRISGSGTIQFVAY